MALACERDGCDLQNHSPTFLPCFRRDHPKRTRRMQQTLVPARLTGFPAKLLPARSRKDTAMDIELARTFLAIVEAGSFVRAAERLNVTQTTVSARVRSLEDQLRRPVFVRAKAGATLTPAGEHFQRFARTLVQVWERARHQVAVPAGRRAILSVGGELSLWSPLLLNWMVWMRRNAADVALQTQVGVPDALLRQASEGVLDIAVVYAPRQSPGLRVEKMVKAPICWKSVAG